MSIKGVCSAENQLQGAIMINSPLGSGLEKLVFAFLKNLAALFWILAAAAKSGRPIQHDFAAKFSIHYLFLLCHISQ